MSNLDHSQSARLGQRPTVTSTGVYPAGTKADLPENPFEAQVAHDGNQHATYTARSDGWWLSGWPTILLEEGEEVPAETTPVGTIVVVKGGETGGGGGGGMVWVEGDPIELKSSGYLIDFSDGDGGYDWGYIELTDPPGRWITVTAHAIFGTDVGTAGFPYLLVMPPSLPSGMGLVSAIQNGAALGTGTIQRYSDGLIVPVTVVRYNFSNVQLLLADGTFVGGSNPWTFSTNDSLSFSWSARVISD